MCIDEHRDRFGVEPIWRALQVAPSTYWARTRAERVPAPRTLADRELLSEIRRVYVKSHRLDGARKVWWQLKRDSITAPRCAVQRLMGADGLQGVVRGKKPRTTVGSDRADRPADLVDRDFTATQPNRLWVADFTYVMTLSGVVYVAFVIDVSSRPIVGWKADTSMKTALILDTLEMALWARQHEGPPVAGGLIHHNDNRSRYLSFAFTSRLIDAGVDASVGSVGDGYDNAVAESTIGLFKTEKIHHEGPWRTMAEVELATRNGSTGSITSDRIPPAAPCPQSSLSKLAHNKQPKNNCLYETRGGSVVDGFVVSHARPGRAGAPQLRRHFSDRHQLDAWCCALGTEANVLLLAG